MSERELTTLLSLMNQRQACLNSACKEIADWIDRQGDVAADYLEGLLDILDLDGDIEIEVQPGRAVIRSTGSRNP